MLLPLALVDAVVELQIWLFGLWVITGSKTLYKTSFIVSDKKKRILFVYFPNTKPSPARISPSAMPAAHEFPDSLVVARALSQCVESKGTASVQLLEFENEFLSLLRLKTINCFLKHVAKSALSQAGVAFLVRGCRSLRLCRNHFRVEK